MSLASSDALISFFAAFAMSLMVTPLFRKLAIYLDIVDKPNQRHKTHSLPVPYLGGLSIISTVCAGLLVAILWQRDNLIDAEQIIVIMFSPLILAIVGLVDDLKNMGAISRLFLQSLFATLVALLFARFGWFGEPTDLPFLNILVSVLWIVGITNALNFIDNLDGGAGGIVVISGLSLAFAALSNNQFAVAATSTLIAGATLGFLLWNLHPARIYLGDSGALFLGASLSVLTIRFDPETAHPTSSWLFAFFIFAVPILDLTIAVVSRFRRGLSPLVGGKDHMSHRLINKGLSRRLTALSIWLLQAYFSSLGLLLLVADSYAALMLRIVAVSSWCFAFSYFLRLAPMGTQNDNRHKN